MHIITVKRLKEFYAQYPDAKPSLLGWNKITKLASWQEFAQVCQTFPSADQVGSLTVFNIAVNKYRLITRINYKTKRVYIRQILTHKKYDTNQWKNDP